MIARSIAHPDQIRWYAQSALNGFETLDQATAIENAVAELKALLRYLELAEKQVEDLRSQNVRSSD